MKTYSQTEWTEIVDKSRGGSLRICGVNLAKDLTIESLRTIKILSGTLEAWGSICAADITEIQGRKQFAFTTDGISLLVDAEQKSCFEPIAPKGIENPKVIPFAKWIDDYVKTYNAQCRRAEDTIYSIAIVGCEINHKGIIGALNAKVTWGGTYGPFGRLTTDKSLELSRDVLCGTYHMSRRDSIHDDWTPNCCGDYGYRAYFTNGFDIVYADDGKYTIYGNPLSSAKVA